MRIKHSKKELAYTGKELRSLFIFHQFGLQGNALVAFEGPCRVELPEMVDQEDVKANAPIYSPWMLHFLGEFFGEDLEKTLLRQRLLMAVILDLLRETAPGVPWRRVGNDLYVRNRKVSVSIATASPVSTLLHAGLNVRTRGAPVPAFGLKEAGISPAGLAAKILKRFQEEAEGIAMARCKVRGVP